VALRGLARLITQATARTVKGRAFCCSILLEQMAVIGAKLPIGQIRSSQRRRGQVGRKGVLFLRRAWAAEMCIRAEARCSTRVSCPISWCSSVSSVCCRSQDRDVQRRAAERQQCTRAERFSEAGAPAVLVTAALLARRLRLVTGYWAEIDAETLAACTVASERYTVSPFAFTAARAELVTARA
jgi:hypothetical protein